jgi:hypothetical protein
MRRRPRCAAPGPSSGSTDALLGSRENLVGDLLTEVVDVPVPPPHRRPRVSIPSVVWRQLLTDSERQQKWARSLERQRHEAREEAEARARYAEQLRQAIEQSPNRALFPAEPSLWLTGQDLLGFLANPSQWRSR